MLRREQEFIEQHEKIKRNLEVIKKEIEELKDEQSRIETKINNGKNSLSLLKYWMSCREKILKDNKKIKHERLKNQKKEKELAEKFLKLLAKKKIKIFDLNLDKVIFLLVKNEKSLLEDEN